jgi:hypothetical protein
MDRAFLHAEGHSDRKRPAMALLRSVLSLAAIHSSQGARLAYRKSTFQALRFR